MGQAFSGLPAAETWLKHQISSPNARARWEQLAGALALALAARAVTIWLALLIVRAPRRRIEQRGSQRTTGRLLFGLLRFLLGLVPIGLFVVVSYTLISIVGPAPRIQIAAIGLVNATILIMGIIALSRLLFAPRFPNLRLVPLSDASASFVHRWICWIGAILAVGWFGISAAHVLGLPRVASEAAFKIVGLAVTIILVCLVNRKRRDVARCIRGAPPKLDHRPGSLVSSTRHGLADVWYILAIAYLVVIFVIWALDLKGGFDFVLRGTLISLALIAVARCLVLVADRGAERGIVMSAAARDRFPHLHDRARRYLPIVRVVVAIVVWLIALIGIIDVWGGDSFGWLESSTGHLVTAKASLIALILVGAVVAWELVSSVTERHLVGAMRNGTAVERSQRVRTLLPLLRNAFLIFLTVVVVLVVLSEIGLDIAPLLAGAGVVGLAIGFGAQTLVKDVITGVFILFENTIAVGDVADLGSGHSGLVEGFSIRTIKLRDSSGGIHTVPFSAVTTVVNMTKDFAYYVFNINVDYAQDTDHVVEVVKALGAELQAEPRFSALILAPIEIIGVDSFGSSAVVLQARFKTKPIQQWTVGREFNRRMKKKFDELGIPMTFPQSVVVTQSAAKAAYRYRKAGLSIRLRPAGFPPTPPDRRRRRSGRRCGNRNPPGPARQGRVPDGRRDPWRGTGPDGGGGRRRRRRPAPQPAPIVRARPPPFPARRPWPRDAPQWRGPNRRGGDL